MTQAKGEYLGEPEQFNVAVLLCYIEVRSRHRHRHRIIVIVSAILIVIVIAATAHSVIVTTHTTYNTARTP